MGAVLAARRRSRSISSRATTERRSGTGSSCSSRCRCSPPAALGLWRMLDVPAGGPPRAEDAPHRRGAALALWLTRLRLSDPARAGARGSRLPRAPQRARRDGAARRADRGARHVAAHRRRGGPRCSRWARGGCSRSRSTSTSARACSAATGAGSSRALPAGGPNARYTTPLIGSAPLEHYIAGPATARAADASVTVREIVETG